MKNGKGIAILPNGNRIEGFFKDSKSHGFFKISSADGM